MVIKGKTLREALRGVAARKPAISIWRKASDGRLVRFMDWRGPVRRSGGAR